ncbi:MAG: hypothetical protein B7Y39_09670 [Bdellovibrio sp. 28-41-41]|nr:MAG: hypothetical protein B7Y39_09670 [Bdellovibrio sp. 28-41-41]
MKNCFKIILASLALSFLSCSGGSDEDNSKYLTFELGSKTAILIPAPAVTSSCEQLSKLDSSTGSVAGTYFSLGNPTIRWTLTENAALSEVRIVALKLILKSPKVGGEYSCIFSDIALGSLYYKVTQSDGVVTTARWDGSLGTVAGGTLNSTGDLITTSGFTGCNIKCGGISVPTNAGKFTVNGIWEIIGVQKKYKSAERVEYDEFPLRTQGEFSVESVLN